VLKIPSTKDLSVKFTLLVLLLSFALTSVCSAKELNSMTIEELKSELVLRASKYTGQGDPDYKIQNELEPFVNRMIELNPQAPVKDRLHLLYGVWKQVWGPYDYRDDTRRVDPSIGVNEIYQVIDPDGFYYNVSPSYKNGNLKKEKINYLKGQYSLSKTNPNGLDVKFLKFPGMSKRPEGRPIYDFVKEAEEGTLPNQVTIVPTFIVRIFFGGGTLVEVYTDETIRILYGSNKDEFKKKYLYVMIRQ
jgi:hypothetical protein